VSSHPDNATRGVAPDPDAGSTLKWGIVGSVVTVLVILLCMVGFQLQVRAEQAQKAGATENSAAVRLKATQQTWIENEHPERNRIGIDEAMGQVIDEAN
jgi:hypothetical protein